MGVVIFFLFVLAVAIAVALQMPVLYNRHPRRTIYTISKTDHNDSDEIYRSNSHTHGEIGERHVDKLNDAPVCHEKPEPGYVILNGEKVRLEDLSKR